MIKKGKIKKPYFQSPTLVAKKKINTTLNLITLLLNALKNEN